MMTYRLKVNPATPNGKPDGSAEVQAGGCLLGRQGTGHLQQC